MTDTELVGHLGSDHLRNHGVVVANVLKAWVKVLVVEHDQNDLRDPKARPVVLQLLVEYIRSSLRWQLNPEGLLDSYPETLAGLLHNLKDGLSLVVLTGVLVDDDPPFVLEVASVLDV